MNPRSFAAGLLLFATTLNGRAESEPERHFREAVKPLLESRCVSCHGAEKVKGGLRLDSRAATLKGGENGPAVVPGNPAESRLLQAVMHVTKEVAMPPKEKLTPKDIAVFERWIRDGAPWPQAETLMAAPAKTAPGERLGNAWSDPRNPIVRIFGGQRLDLWSLQPVRRVEPPAVKNAAWPRTPIDRFMLARIEAAGLKPSAEADRRSLARRVYFDLTGLPPTPAEMTRFLADCDPQAYERLVDELLASPRHGEHAARQWLDVVRYSDSNGFDWDEFRPQAWRFRDYVVRSFNADKPFDQFIREQLAGDELFDGPPRTAAEQDALIATGYLRLGPQDNSAASFNEEGRARAELMADLVETTGGAFLGLTMSCCRCHDHKFDPLSQADHFRLRAFFEPVKYADDLPLDLAPEQAVVKEHNAALDAQIAPFQQQLDALLTEVKERLRAAKVEPNDKEVKAALTDAEKERKGKLEKEIAALKEQRHGFAHGLLMTDTTEPVPTTHILSGGDYKTPHDAVEPGFISALDPNPAIIAPALNKKTSGRRLALANWIASDKNPLTARVLCNRVWQSYFGRGLVATPNDFGLAGARPTHPELLDWMADEFVRGGWSMKKLRRLIVTSAAYRQASCGGDHPLYQSQDLRRLSAEQLRDALLAASGLLIAKSDGPPVWPEVPSEVLEANPAVLDDNKEKTKGWYPSPAAERSGRSLFLVQKRTLRVPFMETFDQPENAVSCARRNASTVAPQALSLLNSPLAIEAAKTLADRIVREAGDDAAEQVRAAFALALQRAPTPEEVAPCQRLREHRSLAELCRALLNLNEFVYLD